MRHSVSWNVNTSEKVGTRCFSPRWQKHEGDAQETFGSVSTRNTETVLLGICSHLFSQESTFKKKSYRKKQHACFHFRSSKWGMYEDRARSRDPYRMHPCSPNPTGPETLRLIRHLRWVGSGYALVWKSSLGDCHAFSHSLLLPETSLFSYTQLSTTLLYWKRPAVRSLGIHVGKKLLPWKAYIWIYTSQTFTGPQF